MTKTLLIDPFSGASGDMLLAALIDAGCPLDRLRETLLGIPALGAVTVDTEGVERGAFAASRLMVGLPDDRTHRGLNQIREIVEGAPSLDERVRQRALEAFARLAGAEARVHGLTVDEVHFHEVGALDAIVDIVGFYAAVELLGIESLRYTRLVVGSGETVSLHGDIPVPAPATLELLKGHRIEFSGRSEELITPTAAAIISTGFEPIPRDAGFTPESIGYGAGTRDAGAGRLPNVLRAALGRLEEAPAYVSIIRTTIDDMNPEVYGHVMERLFAEGALEVYYHPVMMKKNRPGLEVTVISEVTDEQRLAGMLLVHTTTLGVRLSHESRLELERHQETVRTEIGDALVKIAALPDGGEKMSPEFESCKKLADRTERPIVEVFEIVQRAWRLASNSACREAQRRENTGRKR
jgi:uncharacterized protein (TIGR00299 family) protein